MKTFIEQARWLFWEQAGWARLSPRGRWVAVYFALSLCAAGILKEAPLWVWIAVAVNFLNAARLVRRIDLPEPTDGCDDDEANENDDDDDDRPIGAPPASAAV